ncbi:hypothetical protein MARPU_00730 [Marichromatium purpuratum 984]|uniref:Uncharacterized protein n=1 Tax=Marichromatium purpuratum 984 TaxID=765910 RepID=W0E0A7_MARPU|nr:hypothetical protein [Marichromatium purpuratum]AHF02546.1 hypothetical protein MARPU_00730 [Marichromatium purpuratum 984]
MAGSGPGFIFYRPGIVIARESTTLSAPLHNALQLRRMRSGVERVLLPIRAMQYLALIERAEIAFVDVQSSYDEGNGTGGHPIRVAWRPLAGRCSLTEPVGYEIIYYCKDMAQTQRRLITELGKLLLAGGTGRGHAARCPVFPFPGA